MSFFRLTTVTVSLACLLPFAAAAQNTPPAAAPAIVAAPVTAAPAANMGGRPVTRDELPALVKEAIMKEPEMIMEAVKAMREKQEVENKKKAQEGLKKYTNELFSDADSPSVGAKDADVTIVEFFDYHCGYCKHMLPVINQALKEDKKVRFIFKEFPILSEDSVTAARAALAVNRINKDKYFDFHQALMNSSAKFDEKMLMDTAKKVGIDSAKLKAEMAKPEITAILDKNREVAGALSITGTPALVIGDQVAPGAVSYDALKKMIEEKRTGKKAEAPAAEAAKAAPVAAPAPAAAPAAAPAPAAETPKN